MRTEWDVYHVQDLISTAECAGWTPLSTQSICLATSAVDTHDMHPILIIHAYAYIHLHICPYANGNAYVMYICIWSVLCRRVEEVLDEKPPVDNQCCERWWLHTYIIICNKEEWQCVKTAEEKAECWHDMSHQIMVRAGSCTTCRLDGRKW